MNRILDIGYPLLLGNNDEPFIIKDVLGKGASSVTYLAECNQTEHVLKECNPLGLHMHRNDNGALVPDTKLNEDKFKESLARFESGIEQQLAFRLTDDLKNTTSNVQAIYRANGTVYIDMTFFNGKTYDQVEHESLYDLLRRMKALAQVIGHYHHMGYLHLDVKPQNIYAIPETPEMVMMFDFDSVVRKDEVEKMVLLSYTDSWAAPEQKMTKYRKSICEATDLFAIGEIIFHRVMGRHSNPDERFDFSKYIYNRNAKIFENSNPQVFRVLDKLFHKTLCCVPANRVQSANELIDLLDEIIPLANPKEQFLVTTLPIPKEFFIGRDAEIEDIHARLHQSPVLFLHGIGGIGKSELAKQYAKKYRGEYDTVVFAPYITDIVSMITDDTYVRINHFNRAPDQSIEDYYTEKLKKIKDLTSNNEDRILFLVDNLDSTEDPNFKVLSDLRCRVLVTSRMDFSDDFVQIELNAIANPFAIFEKCYKKPLSDAERDMVGKIIDIVGGHTMTVELLAKQMMASRITPKRMLTKLSSGGLRESGNEKVRTDKDGNWVMRSTVEHIQALFDLADLNEDEKYILANLSLIPYSGISTELFGEWCEIDNYDTINQLADGGWIRWNKETDFISLHPVIADIMLMKAGKDSPTRFTLLTALSQVIDDPPNVGFIYTQYGYFATCVLCNRGMCPKELPPLVTKLSGIVIGYNAQSELLKLLEHVLKEDENNINLSDLNDAELYITAASLAEKLSSSMNWLAPKLPQDKTKLVNTLDEKKNRYIGTAMEIISNFIKLSDSNLARYPMLFDYILSCLVYTRGHEEVSSFISRIWDFLLIQDNYSLTADEWHAFGDYCQYNHCHEIAYKAYIKAKDIALIGYDG